ncbi:MAG: CDP-glycerol glycerophosphotransferase family protein [Deltaproteobacteria bacterium]|nr:CDP-glycerol glycerophosphotransferase family protein [Deltaproteobacteria bacterium]
MMQVPAGALRAADKSPAPTARAASVGHLDFYHYDSMDVLSYEPICRYLDNAALVAPASDGVLDFARAELYFRQRGLTFQTEPSGDAAAVVGTQYFWTLGRPQYKRVPVLRLMYSLSEKGGAAHGKEWSDWFDAVLCPGPYSQRLLQRWGRRAIIVGFPKYDDYFRGRYRAGAVRAKFGLDAKRKCALYLPTWAHHSSVDRFAAAIRELAHGGEYQVLYKPHTVTTRLERHRIECFRSEIEAGQLVCIEEQSNMAELLLVADVVLADGMSGAFWEAVIVSDRPVLALHVHGEFERVLMDARVEDFAPVCDEPAALRRSIERATCAHVIQPSPRVLLANELLSYRDGSAGQRAAEVIAELAAEEDSRSWAVLRREVRYRTWRAVHAARSDRSLQRLRHPVLTVRNGLRRLVQT